MPYIPLINLHPLIFSLTSFGWLHSIMPVSTYSIISYGNITFDLYVFILCPLFQEYNWGVQQGLGIYITYIICKAMHLGLVFHCTSVITTEKEFAIFCMLLQLATVELSSLVQETQFSSIKKISTLLVCCECLLQVNGTLLYT